MKLKGVVFVFIVLALQSACTSNQKINDSSIMELNYYKDSASKRCSGSSYKDSFGSDMALGLSAKTLLSQKLTTMYSANLRASVESKTELAKILGNSGQKSIDNFLDKYSKCMDSEMSDYWRLKNNSVNSVLSTSQKSLAGEWKATGYTCDGDIPEEIILITLDNKKIVAKKIKGDDCVRSGEVTFTAILTSGIPGTFPAKLNVADKPNSTKRWLVDSLVEIVSSSEMYIVYDGMKLSYRKVEI